MANTFNTLNTPTIAQRSLSNCLRKFPMFNRISTDFGGGSAKFNQDVIVKLATEVSAVAYDKDNGGYAAQDSADSEITVTMDQHIHITREISVEEAHSTDVQLIERYAELDANAIGKAVMANLLGKVLAADVADNTVSTLGAFGRDTLVDVHTALNLRDVTDAGRFNLLNPAYFGQLLKDGVIISDETNRNGADVVPSGMVGQIHGADTMSYNGLPNNSEALEGLSGVAESFALATRLPYLPGQGDIPTHGRQYVVTEPTSGLSMLVVEYVDLARGCVVKSYRLMFGTAIGNAKTIQRITSA